MKRTAHTIMVQHQLAGAEAMQLGGEVAQLELRRFNQLVLNFSLVSDLDASGIAVLVRLYSQLRRHGIALQVQNCSEQLGEMLQRVALTAVVPVTVRAQPSGQTAPMRPMPA